MNKIISFIKSQKYLLLGMAIVAVLVVLNASSFVKADESKDSEKQIVNNPAIEDSTNITKEADKDFSIASEEDTVPINLITADCLNDLKYSTTPSSTFVPLTSYNLSFVVGAGGANGGLNGFYDINGDNLADYIYTSNQTQEYSGNNNSQMVYNMFNACVYLNNGHGWTKEYRCKATTHIDKQTGEVTIAEYYGDCAGQ